MEYSKKLISLFPAIISLWLFFVLSCGSKKSDSGADRDVAKSLRVIKKHYPLIDTLHLKLHNFWKTPYNSDEGSSISDCELYIHYKFQSKDGERNLFYSYWPCTSDSVKLDKYEVLSVDDSETIVCSISNDTNYCYRQAKKGGEKKFFFGKYYFLYKKGVFSEGQNQFFIANMDSLVRIPGDSLPNLPEF